MQFTDLNICTPILEALKKEGYVRPTLIQEQAIPPLLAGRDLIGCAQTGSGKTAAFAIPALQSIADKSRAANNPRAIKGLVLTPTRELASQIRESFQAYGRYLPLKNTVIFGGVSQSKQVDGLRAGVDILVATPGRLLDLLRQKVLSLRQVNYFVLDEADRMLDMGFIHDVKKIIGHLPQQRQTALFSATMPMEITELVGTILRNPVKVAVAPVASTAAIIEQKIYLVNKSNKKHLLVHLLKDSGITSALVFSRTKHGANKIAKHLVKSGLPAEAIHGNKSQTARETALANFKAKRTRILVATDIAARGIDIDELSHVMNYDLPEVPETYVHRIGRTGRAGHNGSALSFCDEEEKKLLANIQKLIKKDISVVTEHPYPLAAAETRPVQQTAVISGTRKKRRR
ncbi:MAG: DEAD/DEAH box helicase [bacterium]|jgi:ATP-dependent RNA helicase RhlE